MNCGEKRVVAQAVQETLVRFDKKSENYLGLIQLASFLMACRRTFWDDNLVSAYLLVLPQKDRSWRYDRPKAD
jgi:hypothetical protein